MHALLPVYWLVILLDSVATAQHRWQAVDGPTLVTYPFLAPGLFYASAAWDAARDRLVLVDHGGRHWEHDGVRWLARDFVGNTSFLVDDPQRRGMLRGVFAQSPTPSLHVEHFDGAVWTLQPGVLQRVQPSGHPVVDPLRSRLVLVGRSAAANVAIHEWDGTNWQQMHVLPASVASARPLAFDFLQGHTLLHCRVGSTDEIWSWDGQFAVPLAAVNTLFPSASFWNAAASRIELVGSMATASGFQSGLFAWNGTAFVLIAPPPTNNAQFIAACSDPRGFVWHLAPVTLYGHGELHRYANGSWRSIANGNGSLRIGGSMSYAPNLGKVVFVGGYARLSERFFGTSSFDGRDWSWSSDAPMPLRGHAATAADPLGCGVVLFGGEASSGAPFGYSVRGDCWLWDGFSWQQQSSGSVPARSYCAMVLDPFRRRVVMCGGMTGLGPFTFLSDVWEWDGVTWSTAQGLPRGLARHALAYDEGRRRIVLFGGYDGVFRNDTYEWDGSSWLQQSSAMQPPAGLVAMAYDASRAMTTMVVHGHAGREVWNWSGNSWSQDIAPLPDAVGIAPPALFEAGPQLVFDAARRVLLYHDGLSLAALTTTPAMARNHGNGCGNLRLALATPARPAGVVQFDLLDAQATSVGVIGLGGSLGNLGLGQGCSLLLGTSFGSQWLLTNSNGFASQAFVVPNALNLRGVTVYAQGAVISPMSAPGFAVSQALMVTIGE